MASFNAAVNWVAHITLQRQARGAAVAKSTSHAHGLQRYLERDHRHSAPLSCIAGLRKTELARKDAAGARSV